MMAKSEKGYGKLNIIAYSGMLSVGMIIGSLGPLLVPISDSFQLKVSQVSYPVVSNSIGFLLAGFIVSFIWKIHRARLILTLSSLSLVFILLSFSYLHFDIEMLLALLFFIGLSKGILHTGLDSLFSEIYGQKRAKYLNILHVFFTLGAFIGPILVGIILTLVGRWYLVYFLIGLINLPLPFLFWSTNLYTRLDFSKKAEPILPDSNWVKKPLSSALFWSVLLAMFFYVGIEGSLTSWTPLFLTKIRNISPVTASYSMSVFWLAMISGRVLFGHFLSQRDLLNSLILGAGGATLFIILSFLSSNMTPIIIFLASTGLFLSFCFPSLIALGGKTFPQHIGLVTGILTVGGSTGYIFFPWLIGCISEILNLARGVFAIPLLSVSLASVLMYFRYLSRKRNKRNRKVKLGEN